MRTLLTVLMPCSPDKNYARGNFWQSEVSFHSAYQSATQNTSAKCHKIQFFLLMMDLERSDTCRGYKQYWRNTLRKYCAPSWFHLQDYIEMHSQQNIKKVKFFNEQRIHFCPHTYTRTFDFLEMMPCNVCDLACSHALRFITSNVICIPVFLFKHTRSIFYSGPTPLWYSETFSCVVHI